MKLRLHTRHLNSAGQRVRIVLNLKGVPYEYAAIQSPSSKEYRSINPQGLMPALEIDGRFVAQSMAIIELLEELFPEPSIFPEDNLLRAEVRAFAHSRIRSARTCIRSTTFAYGAISQTPWEKPTTMLANGIITGSASPFRVWKPLCHASPAVFAIASGASPRWPKPALFRRYTTRGGSSAISRPTLGLSRWTPRAANSLPSRKPRRKHNPTSLVTTISPAHKAAPPRRPTRTQPHSRWRTQG